MQWKRPDFYRIVYTYSIINITYSDEGDYLLNVLNSQGASHYKFSVNIIENGSLPPERFGDSSLATLLIVLVLVIIVLTVIAVGFVLKRKRDNKREADRRSDYPFTGVHNALYERRGTAQSPGFQQQPVDEDEGFIAIHDTEYKKDETAL
ncbi:uncharacterized protein LOC117339010 [Pecten maximus]|uniref:uncharacterized protein LOC117339010 n=1 Tax=Pecten maximus TaxID=6579 RepID=UPI001458C5D1|nr:uncharacterized protein LOC117339010 [Pecten maximus]